jgi:hypothetical protein
MSEHVKKIIDEFLQERDPKVRRFVLEKLEEACLGVPGGDPKTLEDYKSYLETLQRVIDEDEDGECSPFLPAKEIGDHPELTEKYLTETLLNIKRFVAELWPRRQKKRGRIRKIEIENGWLKTME